MEMTISKRQIKMGNYPAEIYIFKNKSGRAIGMFKIWDWWDGLNISDLYIRNEFRNHGLSHEMIDYAISVCGAKNLAVRHYNTQAKNLYTKHGFIVTETDDTYAYMSIQ